MNVAPETPNPNLAQALEYAARGWRVVPIVPGEKRPPVGNWTEVATVDPARVVEWWAGRYDGFGVGIVCGWHTVGGTLLEERRRCLFVVDIDEGHQAGISGGDTLAELEDAHEPLPATFEVLTGSGGRHLYFYADTEIRNNAGTKLGPGLDVRGEGGQVLAPPTFHPNGTRYELEAGSPADPVDAPAWLIDLLTSEPAVARETPRVAASELGELRPGDRWAAVTTWAEILEADGWQLHHVDRTGEHHWTRPGKERRDGTSATTGYGTHDVLKVFTSSVPALEVEATYTKLGYLAATRHRGDHAEAARWLASQGWGTPHITEAELDRLLPATLQAAGDIAPVDVLAPNDEGWPVADRDQIAAVLAGNWEPPTPTLLARTDGACLLYAGKVHSLAGEPGAGKTWIALAAIAQTLDAGHQAMFVDHEDRLDTCVRRLIQLGCAPEAVLVGLRYVTPTFGVKGGGLPSNVVDLAAGCALVVIDSLGEALAHSQLNQNDDGEVAAYMGRVARRLADGGAAVLLLDHLVKNAEQQGRFAIGSQRKLAAIDGIAFLAVALVSPAKDKAGLVKITVSKDRGGNYQHGSTVAEVSIAPAGNAVDLVVAVPRSEVAGAGTNEFLPTVLMERVSRHLEMGGEPPSGRQIISAVKGDDKTLRTALQRLVEHGNVAAEPGTRGGNVYRLITPFRDDEIDEMLPTAVRGATAVEARCTAAESERGGAVPPYGTAPRSGPPHLTEKEATAVNPNPTPNPTREPII